MIDTRKVVHSIQHVGNLPTMKKSVSGCRGEACCTPATGKPLPPWVQSRPCCPRSRVGCSEQPGSSLCPCTNCVLGCVGHFSAVVGHTKTCSGWLCRRRQCRPPWCAPKWRGRQDCSVCVQSNLGYAAGLTPMLYTCRPPYTFGAQNCPKCPDQTQVFVSERFCVSEFGSGVRSLVPVQDCKCDPSSVGATPDADHGQAEAWVRDAPLTRSYKCVCAGLGPYPLHITHMRSHSDGLD